jgi:CubicO group peptidase (beta-lactamase class C family)
MITLKLGALALAGLVLLGGSSSALADDPFPRAQPEDVGMSSERLALIRKRVEAEIASGQMPGAVLAIARHGRLVYFEAFGYRDKEAGVPMTTDTIFHVASMTKPMVAVGALQLLEEGRLLIDDPLAKYFPKFANMQVAIMDTRKETIVEKAAAVRKVTLQDLFRHTSGLIYGGRGTSAVHKLYPSASAAAATSMTGVEFVDHMSSLPLLYQPGTVWDYGFGLDLLGLVIEQINGESLGRYLANGLWGPLGMADTGFTVPVDKAPRLAKPLALDPTNGRPQETQRLPLKFECGGGCAVSTASDYLRFAAMLMNHGRYRETRILGRKTVEYMLANQLGPEVKNLIGNADPTRADYGFGLGLAVRTTPGIVRLLGSVGDFSWPGATGTNWWADPKEDLVVVWMAATPGALRWKYREMINALVYEAVAD